LFFRGSLLRKVDENFLHEEPKHVGLLVTDETELARGPMLSSLCMTTPTIKKYTTVMKANPKVTMCTSSSSYVVVSVMTMDDAPGASLRKRMPICVT
jgi:hypothetical protein